MQNSVKTLGYMLNGFYDKERRSDENDLEDNFDKLLGRMNDHKLFFEDAENYDYIVDFCISAKPNFSQLEHLSQKQIDFLIRSMNEI